jgi:hypothetical protein
MIYNVTCEYFITTLRWTYTLQITIENERESDIQS